MNQTSDVTSLIAAFAQAATSPHDLPTPAPTPDVRWSRDAQRRFDASRVWARGMAVAS